MINNRRGLVSIRYIQACGALVVNFAEQSQLGKMLSWTRLTTYLSSETEDEDQRPGKGLYLQNQWLHLKIGSCRCSATASCERRAVPLITTKVVDREQRKPKESMSCIYGSFLPPTHGFETTVPKTLCHAFDPGDISSLSSMTSGCLDKAARFRTCRWPATSGALVDPLESCFNYVLGSSGAHYLFQNAQERRGKTYELVAQSLPNTRTNGAIARTWLSADANARIYDGARQTSCGIMDTFAKEVSTLGGHKCVCNIKIFEDKHQIGKL
nr:hypothetical protein CFP56_22271 [Quercus suber]